MVGTFKFGADNSLVWGKCPGGLYAKAKYLGSESTAFAFPGPAGPALKSPSGGGMLPPLPRSQNRICRTSLSLVALKATISCQLRANLCCTLLPSYPNLPLSFIKSCSLVSAVLWEIMGNTGNTHGIELLKDWQCGH